MISRVIRDIVHPEKANTKDFKKKPKRKLLNILLTKQYPYFYL